MISSAWPVNLSAETPRRLEETEALMKEKSVLSDYTLPVLDWIVEEYPNKKAFQNLEG